MNVTAPGSTQLVVRTQGRTFAGTADQVRCARRFVATVMSGLAGADDAVMCVSEIATNAVLHSCSGQPGGSFRINVLIDADVTRVEVVDQGGEWDDANPRAESMLGGRGLAIVAALALRWGVLGGSAARTVWFEL